jgi:glucan phosphoethanolaminetransferase (alkaline phosphatase superfamily)
MNLSKLFSLNLRDALNGFLIAFLTAFLSAVVTALNTGLFPALADLKAFALIGITAGVSYITKNLFTNNVGELMKKDA